MFSYLWLCLFEKKFQGIEEAHLRQMKQLIKGYSHSIEDTHVQVGQVRPLTPALLHETENTYSQSVCHRFLKGFLLSFVNLVKRCDFFKDISYYYTIKALLVNCGRSHLLGQLVVYFFETTVNGETLVNFLIFNNYKQYFYLKVRGYHPPKHYYLLQVNRKYEKHVIYCAALYIAYCVF